MKLKNIFLTLGLAALLGSANAQSDSSMMLDDLPEKPDYVTSTFKGTRLINFHTVETPGKSSLEFRVSHRFGEISTGAKNLAILYVFKALQFPEQSGQNKYPHLLV